MLRVTIVALSLSFLVGACDQEVDPSSSDERADADDDQLVKTLTQKYGLAPKRYTFLFDQSNAAEMVFAEVINQAAKDLSVTPVELGINAISEGAIYELKDNVVDGIDSFESFGIDSLISNVEALRPWISKELLSEIEVCDQDGYLECEMRDPCLRCENEYEQCFYDGDTESDEHVDDCIGKQKLCKGDTDCNTWSPNPCPETHQCQRLQFNVTELSKMVLAFHSMSLREALGVNIAIYLYSKSLVRSDMRRLYGTNLDELAIEAQFFWTSMYFNAGPGTASKQLQQHGVQYYSQPWPSEKPHDWRSAQFHALWRTASFEYALQSID